MFFPVTFCSRINADPITAFRKWPICNGLLVFGPTYSRRTLSVELQFFFKSSIDSSIELHRNLNIPIDTMGRYFNKDKDLIALPDNSEDEMYAGEYLPRRFPSSDLSLEYLKFYQSQADNKTIALVAGIYESEKEADSVLTVLQKVEKKVFRIKAKIYEDCIH